MTDFLFFWIKTLGYVKTKKYSDRIDGVELTCSDKLHILNVYLPYDNNSFESLDKCRQDLGEISAIIQDSNTNAVIVRGDFNVDFKCRFGEEFMYYTADNALQIYDGILRGYRSDVFIYTRGGPCQHGFMCGCKQWSTPGNYINESNYIHVNT